MPKATASQLHKYLEMMRSNGNKNVEKKENIKTQYINPYQLIRTTSLENDPEKFIDLFIKMCDQHDSTYEMSDDYSVYSKGKSEKDSIFATARIIKNSNLDELLKTKAEEAYVELQSHSYPKLIDWNEI
jgi:hypothetical protein